jgi:hypothetical protein
MAVFTNETKSVIVTGVAGTPIGLLLCLTQSGSSSPISWTNQSKNSAAFTNEIKN